jgi:hypothetical protein
VRPFCESGQEDSLGKADKGTDGEDPR